MLYDADTDNARRAPGTDADARADRSAGSDAETSGAETSGADVSRAETVVLPRAEIAPGAPDEETVDDVRQGQTGLHVRWILINSLVAVLLAFAAVWIWRS